MPHRIPSDGYPSPDELLPPTQARGRRFLFLGLILVLLSLACGNVRNPERLFAEKMVATGDIHVMAKSDERAEQAFARALAAQPEEAGMVLTKSDSQARTYQAWLTGPTRDAAVDRLGTLLEKLRLEFTQDSERDVQAFTNAWVVPARTPKAIRWSQRISTAIVGLFLTGAAIMAGGVSMLWVAVQGDKRKLASQIFANDHPGIKRRAHDADDDDPPTAGPLPDAGRHR